MILGKNGSNPRPGSFYWELLVISLTSPRSIRTYWEAPVGTRSHSVTASQPSSQSLSIRAGWVLAGLGFDLWNEMLADWEPGWLTDWLTDVTQDWHDLPGWVDPASPHYPVLISGRKSAWNIFIWLISGRGLGGDTATFLTANQQTDFTVLSFVILGEALIETTAVLMFGIYCNWKFCNLMKIYLLSLYLSIKVNFSSDPIR